MTGNNAVQLVPVVPVVVTYRSGDIDMVAAFETAERTQKAKMDGWAEVFDFALAEPIFIDLPTHPSCETMVREIMNTVERLNLDGVVAASTEYLRRAGLYDTLPDTVRKANKRLWIADRGSLPLWELLY